MSDGRSFIITELAPFAASPARFEWTADKSTTNALGGARACPRAPWSLGVTMKSVRTDYPNAVIPTEQALGSRRKPFTLTGRWQDKYNFAGYAEAELDRFEKMTERGNRCRFQYGNQIVEGLIVDFDPEYRRPWDISYAFTVSVHNRPDRSSRSRVPSDVKAATKSFDDVDLAVRATLEAHKDLPRPFVAGTLSTDTDALLASMTDAHAALSNTIDNRAVLPRETPVDAFTRVATQFRTIRGAAFNTLIRLAEVRSDLDMAAQTAVSVLSFETWSRGVRYASRIALGNAHDGDKAASTRAAPDAQRLYRPQAGESLYAISRKFYGTPFAWHLIADRNALQSFNLTGAEVLVIPDRGGA
jgi:hypothetical protein